MTDRDCMDLSLIGRECRHNSERWFPSLHDGKVDMTVFYAMGLAGEVGEVCNLVKKYVRGTMTKTELAEKLRDDTEGGDVFVYLLLLMDELGIDLFDSLMQAQAKCEERWGTGAQAGSVQ